MDEEIQHAIRTPPVWAREKEQVEKLFQENPSAARELLANVVQFSEDEKEVLIHLKNKNCKFML